MPDYPCHRQLYLTNFTVFQEASFEFSSGVNVFIGENGSGKTHLLKAMYAYQRPFSREVPDLTTALKQLFQTNRAGDVLRSTAKQGANMEVRGLYGDSEWKYEFGTTSGLEELFMQGKPEMARPVFIPAMDMMGHTLQFNQAYNQVYLDFDLTCYDIVTLFTLENKVGLALQERESPLTNLLGGKLEFTEGRFYLRTAKGQQAMPMVAEGIRKIAALVRLQRNGWLGPGTTLFWDEPETNINPVFMDELIGAILALARQGVQVFLTTHSYVILKELDLQATEEDQVRFFSLKADKAGTQVMAADNFTSLEPNPILQQYGSLYDRDIRRASGRQRRP